MSKAPPGVNRIVAVLNFFAEHPGQSFTFTDIVRALDLGRATCHALLAGLVEAQYLHRNVDKTYVIGPALALIGKIANEQFSPMQAAQPEMRALSDECRAICSAVYHEHGNAVIRVRAGSGSHLGWSVPQGIELPLRAPFAGAFFAASKPYDVERWLDRLTPAATERERKDLMAGIEFTRKHGFSFGVFNPGIERNVDAPELVFTGKKAEYPVSTVAKLTKSAEYHLAFIVAPVFNRQRETEFVLNLSGFREPVSGKRVEEMGEMLRAAVERITYFINGRSEPYPFPE